MPDPVVARPAEAGWRNLGECGGFAPIYRLGTRLAATVGHVATGGSTAPQLCRWMEDDDPRAVSIPIMNSLFCEAKLDEQSWGGGW
jgi:hypothetical protein